MHHQGLTREHRADFLFLSFRRAPNYPALYNLLRKIDPREFTAALTG